MKNLKTKYSSSGKRELVVMLLYSGSLSSWYSVVRRVCVCIYVCVCIMCEYMCACVCMYVYM